MEMTDKELLEKAAKAYGLKGHYAEKHPEFGDDWVETGFWYNNEDDCTTAFNSLVSDGDALRLAVKLCFDVCVTEDFVCVIKRGYTEEEFSRERIGCDRYSSTRRAITRAAAMMCK